MEIRYEISTDYCCAIVTGTFRVVIVEFKMFTCLFSATDSTVTALHVSTFVVSPVGGRTLTLFLFVCFEGFPGNFDRPIFGVL